MTLLQMALPPPDQRRAELLDGTGRVGWIEGARLGFTGFETLDEAAAAVWVAHLALERRRARSAGRPAPHVEPVLSLAREGNEDWILVGDQRVARLLRPEWRHDAPASDGAADTARWFAFEIIFPRELPELIIESNAHVVYRGLRRSGVRWAMRTASLAAPSEIPIPDTAIQVVAPGEDRAFDAHSTEEVDNAVLV